MAMNGRRPWAPSRPMAMGCMTWRVMCGNGPRTGTRSVIQQTRPRLAVSRSIREGGRESRVLILHNRSSAFQEECSKVGPSSARLITACGIARRHVFPRRLTRLRATSASGVLSMSLLINDPGRMVYPLSTKTLFGNIIGIRESQRGTIMHLNKLFQPSVGADYGLSKNKTDGEIGHSTVMLSAAKGPSRWAQRCFAALSMTVLSSIRMSGLLC